MAILYKEKCSTAAEFTHKGIILCQVFETRKKVGAEQEELEEKMKRANVRMNKEPVEFEKLKTSKPMKIEEVSVKSLIHEFPKLDGRNLLHLLPCI